jgi:hypothetical protein
MPSVVETSSHTKPSNGPSVTSMTVSLALESVPFWFGSGEVNVDIHRSRRLFSVHDSNGAVPVRFLADLDASNRSVSHVRWRGSPPPEVVVEHGQGESIRMAEDGWLHDVALLDGVKRKAVFHLRILRNGDVENRKLVKVRGRLQLQSNLVEDHGVGSDCDAGRDIGTRRSGGSVGGSCLGSDCNSGRNIVPRGDGAIAGCGWMGIDCGVGRIIGTKSGGLSVGDVRRRIVDNNWVLSGSA